jgi:V/A-type H+-transporting ATPase subunit I
MIVPMKKVALLVQAKDAESAVLRLRTLGVVHVENQAAPAGRDIASLRDDIAALAKVNVILSAPGFRGSSGIRNAKLLKDWRFAAKHIIDMHVRLDHLGEYGRGLAASIAQWAPWGDFDPVSLRHLSDKGIFVKFYEIPEDALEGLPDGVIARKISSLKGTAYCAVISLKETAMPFKEVPPPKIGLNEMRLRLAENGEIEERLKKAIRQYTCFAERFLQIHAAFGKELELHEALRGMGSA